MNESVNISTSNINTEKEPSSLKLVFSLGIAGLLSGIILVGTFVYTNPMIKANKEAAIQRAIFKVLPGCASYTTMAFENSKLIEQIVDDNKKQEVDKTELVVYAGYNSGKELIVLPFRVVNQDFRM